jgi:hypothetical protein
MIPVAAGTKVHLACRPVSMRYGFDGLCQRSSAGAKWRPRALRLWAKRGRRCDVLEGQPGGREWAVIRHRSLTPSCRTCRNDRQSAQRQGTSRSLSSLSKWPTGPGTDGRRPSGTATANANVSSFTPVARAAQTYYAAILDASNRRVPR